MNDSFITQLNPKQQKKIKIKKQKKGSMNLLLLL